MECGTSRQSVDNGHANEQWALRDIDESLVNFIGIGSLIWAVCKTIEMVRCWDDECKQY